MRSAFSCLIRHDLRWRVCHAKTIASSAIVLTISAVTIFGADTPTKISLPFIAVLRSPWICSLFVFSAISFCAGFIHSSPGARIPLRSTITTSPIPSSRRSLQIEIPADPAPLMTTLASENFLFTSLSALVSPADTMIAVPCWSSWKIGMSHFSLSFFSISKHLGAEISSRLTPPKDPEIR